MYPIRGDHFSGLRAWYKGTGRKAIASAELLIITVTRLPIAVTFHEDHARELENVGGNNDQSGDRAVTTSARNCVTSSQVIEFMWDLGDTMISRVTSKKSPHRSPTVGAAIVGICGAGLP